MQSLYEKLMGRVSNAIKPVFLSGRFKPKKTPKKEELGFRPFITVSREPGSGGRPISKQVAKLTDFTYYNKALIEKISKSAKQRKQLIQTIDEKGRTMIQDFIHSLFNPDYISDASYIKHLSNVVLALTGGGDVVILGRGANFFTSHRRGLHVRVGAPYSVRVERAIKYEKVPRNKARDIIKKVDKDRRKFVSQYFNRDISNADYYDLVLNTSNMTIEDAVKLIIKAFELKFPGYLQSFRLRKKRAK